MKNNKNKFASFLFPEFEFIFPGKKVFNIKVLDMV